MGFLRALFSGGRPTKGEFIKSLLRERIEAGGVFDQWRNEFDSMTEMMVMGTPEAAIVTIAETYAMAKRKGWEDKAIFAAIEQHRSQIGSGTLPSPLNLRTYIRYRLDIEHKTDGGIELTEEFVQSAIEKSLKYFGA